MKIMVSACLLGQNCKYNGGNNYSEKVAGYIKGHEVIPVCPEVEGGLPVPRIPCEIVNGIVTNKQGESKDKEFRFGAGKCLQKAIAEKVDLVILQSRSPSCGVKQIYDGSFSGTLIEGKGVFAELLAENGIKTMDLDELQYRKIDDDIELISYYRNDEESLPWYQDPVVCKQVDNIDHVYDLDTLHAMYDFLSSHGNCYYIRYRGKLVGDVSLRDNAELAIVICKEYQNRHIGRKCILDIIELAKEKGMDRVKANIYSFNTQSQRMFEAVGFIRTDDEWFEYSIKKLLD